MNRALTVLIACTMLLSPFAHAAEHDEGNQLVAVVNARNPTRRLTNEQLKNIMLGNTSFWHGVVPVKVFVREKNAPAMQKLLETVLDMTAARFNELWTARQLSGQGIAPTVVAGADKVVAEVMKVPGAVGIMLQSEAWSVSLTGVQVLPLN